MKKPGFAVKTPVYEGPLDLLLDLVGKRKLFINDVSLAAVTDDFIKYIEEHDDFPLDESAEFIVLASTLMLIKSRSLLPTLELSEEEEENIHDLENRLIIYARVKEISQKLRQIYGREIIFEKTPSRNELVVFSPDSKTNLTDLNTALRNLILSLPKKETLPQTTVKKMVSLEETIEKLTERISSMDKMNFRDFYGREGTLTHEKKVSIIVGFLAMLELVKRGIIRASQDELGNIEMERESLVTIEEK